MKVARSLRNASNSQFVKPLSSLGHLPSLSPYVRSVASLAQIAEADAPSPTPRNEVPSSSRFDDLIKNGSILDAFKYMEGEKSKSRSMNHNQLITSVVKRCLHDSIATGEGEVDVHRVLHFLRSTPHRYLSVGHFEALHRAIQEEYRIGVEKLKEEEEDGAGDKGGDLKALERRRYTKLESVVRSMMTLQVDMVVPESIMNDYLDAQCSLEEVSQSRETVRHMFVHDQLPRAKIIQRVIRMIAKESIYDAYMIIDGLHALFTRKPSLFSSKANLTLYDSACNDILNACGKYSDDPTINCQAAHVASGVLLSMHTRSVIPSVQALRSALQCFSKQGDFVKAAQCFVQILQLNSSLESSEKLLTTLLRGVSINFDERPGVDKTSPDQELRVQLCETILNGIIKAKHTPDAETMASMMSLYSDSRMYSRALVIYDWLQAAAARRNSSNASYARMSCDGKVLALTLKAAVEVEDCMTCLKVLYLMDTMNFGISKEDLDPVIRTFITCGNSYFASGVFDLGVSRGLYARPVVDNLLVCLLLISFFFLV
jgi:hypothetical protein